MKAILIDPWKRSIETIQVREGTDREAIQELYKLVGEEGLDFWKLAEGESILVGDRSAMQDPPLPCFRLGGEIFYGRAVVLGYKKDGSECETRLEVDDISRAIDW